MIDSTKAATPRSTASTTPLASRPVLGLAQELPGPRVLGGWGLYPVPPGGGPPQPVGARIQAHRASFRSLFQRKGFANHVAAPVVKALSSTATAPIGRPVQSKGPADQQKGRMAVRLTRTNWVASTAIALIAVQLVIRAVLAFGGYFYWDDLILVGRAGTQDLLSPAYLFDDHDGHVMPGAFLVAGRHHPAGAAELDRAGDQPGGAATAGVAGAAARAARHPGLAAGAADAADVRAVHPAGRAWIRVVGRGAELAADARRAGLGVRPTRSCWCAPAISATRSPALLVYLRRPAVLREGRGDPVRRVRGRRAARPRHRRRLALRTVWRRGVRLWVGVAGADRRLDRALPGRRRSAAVELATWR